MNGFVQYPYHAAYRSAAIPFSNRCSWAGQGTIWRQTRQICGRFLIPSPTGTPSDNQPVFSTPKAVFNAGGGFLGVGPSEIVVILAVGWFLLGPKKLYSLAKDTGRLLGELRRTANDARESLNEAIELDAITAEFEEGKKLVQDINEPLSKDKVRKETIEDESDTLLEKHTTVEDESAEVEVSPEAPVYEPAVNSAFLEQLQRVADPNQKPPEDLPDIDIDMAEELEVRKLEKQYFEARERLEKRRKHRPETTGAESETIAEER